ncbi:MAG: hypothetical protein ACI8RZ_002112 [Myxococcota bacterium]|jgi:hypothetical protein
MDSSMHRKCTLALLEHWMRGSYTWHTSQTARYTYSLSVAPTASGRCGERARAS